MLRKTIEQCDAMIHIVGEYYGWEPSERKVDEPRRSYTQMEYEAARELGIPVFLFLCKDNFPFHQHAPEDPEKRALQKRYREELAKSNYLYTEVATPEELELKVVEALSIFLQERNSKTKRPLSTLAILGIVATAVVLSGLLDFGVINALRKDPAAATKTPAAPAAAAGATQPAPMKFVKPPAGWKGPVAGVSWVIPDSEIVLLPIAPGTFKMGSPASEEGRDPDEKLHQVTISRYFWMGKFEVTQEQWTSLMGSNPSVFKDSGKDAPVDSVSWHDAMAFCKKLNEREAAAGRLPAGYSYTLPTDAEWEYAARAGTSTAFGGTSEKVKLGDIAWYWENSKHRTHPAGQKKPNAWGLHDMHGNVFEWCSDWVENYSAANTTDPVGQTAGSHRVVRGGSWEEPSRCCRSAFRDWKAPGDRYWFLGFRVVLRPIIGE
jgi:formylglycine-generating enzyme required for sulfatase activity